MQDTVFNSIVNGVYVLTAQHDGKTNGTTVAWVTPVSFEPLLVMVSLAGIRYSHELVKKSGYFGINVLGSGESEAAKHFGFNSGRDRNKFEGYNFSTSENGLPILEKAMAYIECRVVNSFPADEHTMFVGEVVEAKALKENDKPLIFRQGDYF